MYRWHALLGKFRFEEELVIFEGETTTFLDQPAAAVGNAISDQRFSGGMLRGTIRFSEIGEHSACQVHRVICARHRCVCHRRNRKRRDVRGSDLPRYVDVSCRRW